MNKSLLVGGKFSCSLRIFVKMIAICFFPAFNRKVWESLFLRTECLNRKNQEASFVKQDKHFSMPNYYSKFNRLTNNQIITSNKPLLDLLRTLEHKKFYKRTFFSDVWSLNLNCRIWRRRKFWWLLINPDKLTSFISSKFDLNLELTRWRAYGRIFTKHTANFSIRTAKKDLVMKVKAAFVCLP